jgi:signal transduction histidine kinase
MPTLDRIEKMAGLPGRAGDDRISGEQAALRRVATLVARRSAVPVDLDNQVGRRLPEPAETAAYYTVAEALTNAAKHARASSADIQVTASGRVLHLRVRDNGRGGADFSHGSGLVGLKDRAEALGGHLELRSPPGAGTTVDITLPLDEPGEPQLPPIVAGQSDDAGTQRRRRL